MGRINNVDLSKVMEFGEQIKNDPDKAKRTQVIEGEWLINEGGAQFRSAIKFEGGETVFEVDSPTFMGGGGKFPGPMHYCFYGLASCYTATFATMAAMLGIELKKEVRLILNVVSDAPEDKIREAEELAIQRCPVVFTLKNPVKLTPSIKISR